MSDPQISGVYIVVPDVPTVAVVQSFAGPITINVERVVMVNCWPVRVYGDGCKFKQDEEPFVLKQGESK